MRLLAIETSSPVLSLALWDGKKLFEKKIEGFLNHAEGLLPLIDKTLRQKKLSLAKIDAFLIGRGPGSFTGLRVGFATYKALGALGFKNFYGGLTLDLIAENVPLEKKISLHVALDARKDKIYSRNYKAGTKGWQPKGKPVVVPVEDWERSLPAGAVIVGDALARYQTLLEKTGPKNFRVLGQNEWYPKASSLIKLFLEKSKKIVPLKTPFDFLPLYFRLSEAEERRGHANSR